VARQFQDRVAFVGVGSRDGVPPMREFVDRHGMGDLAMAADVDGVVWQRFGIVAQPAWVFVDGETGAVTRELGELSEADLRARLEELSGGTT
jgi:hypothetical protein